MNLLSLQSAHASPSKVLQFGTIAILSIVIGLVSALYSPLVAGIGASLFTIAAVALYVHSVAQYQQHLVVTTAVSIDTGVSSRLLFFLLSLSLFLSITIPKSGRMIRNIPITTANIVILLTLMLWVLRLFFSEGSIFRLPVSTSLFAFILYGIAAVLIGFVNDNSPKFIIIDFVAFIGFIPVYFLVCTVLRTPRQLQKVVWLIILSLILVCTYGMLQKQIGFKQVAVPGITEQYDLILYSQFGGRWNIIAGGLQKVYSTFQNGNIFGHHLATFLPFFGGFFLGLRTPRKKLFFFGVFLFCCYILILTYSRGALVGTISGFMVLAVISKTIRLKAFIGIVVVFFLLLGLLWFYADQAGMERYDVRKIAVDPNSFSAGRLQRAQEVLKGFAALPLFSKVFGLGFGGTLSTPYWDYDYVDNLYLTLLYKMGVVGIGILAWVIGHLLRTLLLFRTKIDDFRYQALIHGGIAGLVASLVHNLADTLWLFPPLAANFWFLAGISIAVGAIATQNAQQEKSAAQQTGRQRVR
ncbi:hypothetical protein GF339_12135 [candidate division KSB3 bacterium]|uniref:O-antigen ligase-related domain-containing protein n=1 Tax=candidate division KSB3 bacterium TaxID=2044937 RepID=A0A9D5JW14_9BACT|nr:hypothetical protein [candidate division KSB3 bacterium]MBD3325329.1 hypothetical protein [candidate division KSB3 bacterium]